MPDEGYQITLADLDTSFGKMYREPSALQTARTSGRSSRKSSILRRVPVMCLDLTPGAGNLLGLPFWELNSAWLGEYWTLNTGESPSAAVVSSLSRILEASPHHRYYLSRTACLGILRRAKARGKPPIPSNRLPSVSNGSSPCRQTPVRLPVPKTLQVPGC